MNEPATGWRIDPATLRLIHPDEPAVYTADEFARQQWPPCPVCGTRVDVAPVDTTRLGQSPRRYQVGRWQCPHGCDPRPVVR